MKRGAAASFTIGRRRVVAVVTNDEDVHAVVFKLPLRLCLAHMHSRLSPAFDLFKASIDMKLGNAY